MTRKSGKEERRGRRWLWICLTLLAVLGLPAGCLAWGAYSLGESGREQPVPCDKAMEYAKGALPAGARDARCSGAHWQDTYVRAEFRMERAGAEAWIAKTWPTAQPSEPCDTDLCRDVDYNHADPSSMSVKLTYEDGETALVRLFAHGT
ncbi:hypothetical protein AB0A69_25135 [Streptomyces sp. NPDC045431]|uniref:hypothetical protein n=1 Tax=Streptomyces sp. NPDC045431 TaxID=3155613 RepID=UPI0033CE2C44